MVHRPFLWGPRPPNLAYAGTCACTGVVASYTKPMTCYGVVGKLFPLPLCRQGLAANISVPNRRSDVLFYFVMAHRLARKAIATVPAGGVALQQCAWQA